MEPLLIGVLLDVSGSMEQSAGKGIDTGDREWARSIFSVLDNLIEKDLKSNNHIFAIGFGGNREVDPDVFDLLGSIEKEGDLLDLGTVLHEILRILKRNGAHNVDKWAPMTKLIDVLKGQENNCKVVLNQLQRDSNFIKYVVNECLPPACRDFKGRGLITGALNVGYRVGCSTVTNFVTATEKDIDDVVEKIKLKMDSPLKPVSDKSVFDVHVARRILRGHIGNENELTKKRVDELMDKVRPYIYGGTPLYEALGKSAEMFRQFRFRDYKKLLFVLSDGQPADKNEFLTINKDEITIVSCFITSSDIDPYVIHSSATDTQEWEPPAQFMFNLSSTMLTQNVPRTIFVQRRWTVEMINNETKLFLQVNHPDHLKNACEFAREVVTSQEALSDIITSVNLDVYINQYNNQLSARKQVGCTCYANASATVLHLAMKRILGRNGGYPDFESLRDAMIKCYGKEGAVTEIVLQDMCHRYRLRCKKVDKAKAMRAIMEKRPVVATFRLTDKEWSDFGSFYDDNPKGVLTSDDINKHDRKPNEKTSGHAVVLTSFNSKCLRFMNSWGTKWGHGGFFNVQNADVLDLEFFDVYWYEGDLEPEERAYYAAHGSKIADKLMKNLIGLQESTFECPLCKYTSKVTEFKGSLSSVMCPKCHDTFKCGTKGNILALNLYLTSLSDKNATISDRDQADSDNPDTPDECKHQ